MKRILTPKRSGPYPDRDIDCQQAIKRAYQDLLQRMDRLVAVGSYEAVEQLALADRLHRVNKGIGLPDAALILSWRAGDAEALSP